VGVTKEIEGGPFIFDKLLRSVQVTNAVRITETISIELTLIENRNIFVTPNTGFIGSTATDKLIKQSPGIGRVQHPAA
jgi:hypothetical protein